MHFDNTLDFLDLFLPIQFSSSSRARAFLWLIYYYLEFPSSSVSLPDEDDYDGDGSSASATNPFADKYALRHPGKIPLLKTLTPEEMASENVDSEEEKLWGEKMLLQRKEFRARMDKAKDKKAAEAEEGAMVGPGGEGKVDGVLTTGLRRVCLQGL
jgi:Ino eighty subunit 1